MKTHIQHKYCPCIQSENTRNTHTCACTNTRTHTYTNLLFEHSVFSERKQRYHSCSRYIVKIVTMLLFLNLRWMHFFFHFYGMYHAEDLNSKQATKTWPHPYSQTSYKFIDKNVITQINIQRNRWYINVWMILIIISHAINPFCAAFVLGYIKYTCILFQQQKEVDSSSPSASYMRQWIGSALDQRMACRLFGAKPLSEPKLGCY